MPFRSCSGCDELVDVRDFAAHRASHVDAARGGARARGYDTGWARIRDEHLALEPWCRFHLERGEQVAATDVDHIVPRRDGGADDHDNLRSLCKSCHSRRTAIDSSGWGRRSRGASR